MGGGFSKIDLVCYYQLMVVLGQEVIVLVQDLPAADQLNGYSQLEQDYFIENFNNRISSDNLQGYSYGIGKVIHGYMFLFEKENQAQFSNTLNYYANIIELEKEQDQEQ